MRIVLGMTMLYDVWTRFGLLREFYTDDGVSPRSLVLDGPLRWQSLFSISGSYPSALLLLIVHGVLLVSGRI